MPRGNKKSLALSNLISNLRIDSKHALRSHQHTESDVWKQPTPDPNSGSINEKLY